MRLKKIFTSIILGFTILINQAQTWNVTEEGFIPQETSNNAIGSGIVNGVPYVYSFGGIDNSKVFSGIHLKSWRFNTITKAVESIPNLPGSPAEIAMAASSIKNIIYIMGGYSVAGNGNETSSTEVHRFNIQTNNFMSDGMAIPKPIDDHVQAVWKDSLIFIITGWSNTTNVPDVQIYNPSNNTWQTGTSTPNTTNYKSFGASGVIVGDTIYYFGGATSTGNFGPQKNFRKGIINPNNPTQITWFTQILDANLTGYRMSATTLNNRIFWLGGALNTYNFNGIAYDNSGGVEPAYRSLSYNTTTSTWDTITTPLPMDLRGIAKIQDGTYYLMGGMLSGQQVSNKILKLTSSLVTNIPTKIANKNNIIPFPNPTNSFLKLNLKTIKGLKTIQLLNINGQLVKTITTQNTTYKINTEKLSKGIYFLRINNGIPNKIIIE